MVKDYDIIIVGAGPAGLAIGSELSKKLKVLIIEKNIAGITTKSWFDPLRSVPKELMKFTKGGVTRFLADTFTGAKIEWNAKLYKKYPFIKEKEILKYWIGIIKKNKSKIIDNVKYIDHKVFEDHIFVKTTNGKFKGKLLIDASGHNSPIREKYHLEDENLYWWSVYGAIVSKPDKWQSVKTGDYMLWQTFADTNRKTTTSLRHGRPVFEYEIFDNKTGFLLMLYLRKKKISAVEMKKEFMHIIRKEDSTLEFHDIKIEEIKYGWYPSGSLTQTIPKDRIVFVGDSGCWTTPCGWGMGFILNNFKEYSKRLIPLVKKNKLDKESLEILTELRIHQKHEILFDTIMTHFLSNANAKQLDQFINLFTKIDPIVCEKMFTLNITQKEIRDVLKIIFSEFELVELIKIIPKEDYSIILEEAGFLVEDAAIEEIKKILEPKSERSKINKEEGFKFS